MGKAQMPGAVVILAGVLAVACGTSALQAPPGTTIPGPETVALASSLERQGASVAFAEVMPTSAHPYFRMPAARYVMAGESIYAFEYESESSAAAEAGRIAADGSSVGTTQISWTSDPHFYRSDRVIVVYVGRTSSTLALLAKALGPQIAGR